VLEIQKRGGLVEEQYGGLLHQGRGDDHLLVFTAAQAIEEPLGQARGAGLGQGPRYGLTGAVAPFEPAGFVGIPRVE
jgi:hypothetical protein